MLQKIPPAFAPHSRHLRFLFFYIHKCDLIFNNSDWYLKICTSQPPANAQQNLSYWHSKIQQDILFYYQFISIILPLHVSSRFTAHHQEILFCTYKRTAHYQEVFSLYTGVLLIIKRYFSVHTSVLLIIRRYFLYIQVYCSLSGGIFSI
jgi:hypothetical protein